MRNILIIFLLLLAGVSQARSPKREMRGTWIATVANIDWPSSAGINAEQQKKEMLAILDNVTATNMNCVVFQIRPTADAFYRSSHEPWSHWLTGAQGMAPSYDPLEFVIDECDKRGISVHVWINPYRVWLDMANLGEQTRSNLYLKYSDWLVTYGKSMYLHPADQRARNYVSKVVADIVRNYDIDAIHMDDYFYPYRVTGQDFPDDKEYRKDPRGFKNKNDWRRDNVDRIIRQISDTIKQIKPWVEFGISPFGVWRNKTADPKGSATQAGQTNYDDLYADILKWEREGWIDYVAPQLYWQIGFRIADYKILADWWDKNANGTITYIGHASYRIDPNSKIEEWRTPKEIVRQVELNRTHPNIHGSIMYSAKSLGNPLFRQSLTTNVYRQKSIWPENNRIEPIEPMAPGGPYIYTDWTNLYLGWQPEAENRRFIIYRFEQGVEPDFENPENIVAITGKTSIVLPLTEEKELDYRYYVSALSLTHRESNSVEFIWGYSQ